MIFRRYFSADDAKTRRCRRARERILDPMRLDLSLAIEVRPLRDGDLDGLEWDSEQAIQADYVRKTVAERSDDVVFLLALANGRPVGRLGLDFGRKAAERIVHLWAFGVLPSLQRLGIGTALMRAAESLIAAAPRGATVIEVGVDEWNRDAARLYRRLGYRDDGVERGGNGEVILLLRRPIADVEASA
jgi:ribosomal protein S18 acetylase RimI-like enzyme